MLAISLLTSEEPCLSFKQQATPVASANHNLPLISSCCSTTADSPGSNTAETRAAFGTATALQGPWFHQANSGKHNVLEIDR